MKTGVYCEKERQRIIDVLEDIADGGYEFKEDSKFARITLLGEFGMTRTLEFPLRILHRVQKWVLLGGVSEPPSPSVWIKKKKEV